MARASCLCAYVRSRELSPAIQYIPVYGFNFVILIMVGNDQCTFPKKLRAQLACHFTVALIKQTVSMRETWPEKSSNTQRRGVSPPKAFSRQTVLSACEATSATSTQHEVKYMDRIIIIHNCCHHIKYLIISQLSR